ncbi:MAG: hypothetical protein VB049_00870 [Candidatus Pelethousia sp.]|nr:hypothetical protein [Candidatus Pelethousia sp.]
MRKIILIGLIVVLTLGSLVCMLGFRREIQAGEPLFLRSAEKATSSALNETPLPAESADPIPLPSASPLAEDPALCASMAWDALFAYPSHEAPIRVLALFAKENSPGDVIYQTMLADGKLMAKGVYHADADGDAKAWTEKALQGVTIGLLDSIYAETPELALAAYEALCAAERNDSVEVICAGITEDVLAAMRKDHFAMGAAAGVYENEMQVVYADDLLGK